jgi:LysM repeat protein
MRTPVLVGLVVLLHAAAVSTFVFMQGCQTAPRTTAQEPPPAPVLPPGKGAVPSVSPRPVFQPPAPVRPEPAMTEPLTGSSYTVQKGDSLSVIAKRFGVSAREIAEINNLKDPNKIVVGQKLSMPGHASAEPKPADAAKPKAVTAPPGGSVYVVQAGDSLSRIASRHGTSVKALRDANKLTTDRILVGQKLAIPGADKTETAEAKKEAKPASESKRKAESSDDAPAAVAKTAAAPAPAPAPATDEQMLPYTVQAGDTLDEIAKLFIVNKADLLRINNLTDESSIKPGQKLRIPPPDF